MPSPTPASVTPADGSPAPVSRPRGRRPVGRERILDAAAELFTRHGYAATSTREITRKVGIQQPSLYYHFSLKSDILAELLLRTATPSIEHAQHLQAQSLLSPLEKLTGLVGFDVRLLCGGDWNLGSLYLLPEVNSEDFAAFRDTREELKGYYRTFVQAADDAGELRITSVGRSSAIVYSLVEGVILRRADEPDLDAETTAEETCQAVLRILGA